MASQEIRDPRTDPAVGDVLRTRLGYDFKVVAIHGGNIHYLERLNLDWGWDKRPFVCTLSEWRMEHQESAVTAPEENALG